MVTSAQKVVIIAYYKSPERKTYGRVSPKSDVYSFGTILQHAKDEGCLNFDDEVLQKMTTLDPKERWNPIDCLNWLQKVVDKNVKATMDHFLKDSKLFINYVASRH